MLSGQHRGAIGCATRYTNYEEAGSSKWLGAVLVTALTEAAIRLRLPLTVFPKASQYTGTASSLATHNVLFVGQRPRYQDAAIFRPPMDLHRRCEKMTRFEAESHLVRRHMSGFVSCKQSHGNTIAV